jgi:hypothetical protein
MNDRIPNGLSPEQQEWHEFKLLVLDVIADLGLPINYSKPATEILRELSGYAEAIEESLGSFGIIESDQKMMRLRVCDSITQARPIDENGILISGLSTVQAIERYFELRMNV